MEVHLPPSLIWVNEGRPLETENGYLLNIFSYSVPLFATTRAIEAYGEETIRLCVDYCRKQAEASEHRGLVRINRFSRRAGDCPNLVLISDEIAPPEEEDKVVALLEDELDEYEYRRPSLKLIRLEGE